MKNASLASRKRRVLWLCFALYLVAYLCRSNLSAVLDIVMQETLITKSMAGLVGTLFFWTYAAGQLINGYLVQRHNPKRMAALGISVALLCNLAIALFPNYHVLLVGWGINGFAISILWPAIIKIFSNWYTPEEYRKISVLISLPTTLGYVFSWSGLRILATGTGWRTAFMLPAALAAVFVFVWCFLLNPEPEEGEGPKQADKPEAAGKGDAFHWGRFLVSTGVIFVGMVAIIQGFIKESVNLWAPTFLNEMNPSIDHNALSIFSILIPIIGTGGFFFTGGLIKRFKNASFQPLLILGVLGALLTVGLWMLSANLLPVVILNGLLMAVLSGINLLVTTFIPLGYSGTNRTAQLSGMLNFLAYVGAAIGGVASGYIGGTGGWSLTFLLWFGLCIVAVFATMAWNGVRKAREIAW